jgi:hypothetical protein
MVIAMIKRVIGGAQGASSRSRAGSRRRHVPRKLKARELSLCVCTGAAILSAYKMVYSIFRPLSDVSEGAIFVWSMFGANGERNRQESEVAARTRLVQGRKPSNVATAGLIDAFSNLNRTLMTGFGSYRPELHYMRGPGPKWHAKNDPAPLHFTIPAASQGHQTASAMWRFCRGALSCEHAPRTIRS